MDAEGRIRAAPERGQRARLEAWDVAFALDRVDLGRFAPPAAGA